MIYYKCPYCFDNAEVPITSISAHLETEHGVFVESVEQMEARFMAVGYLFKRDDDPADPDTQSPISP